jgi:hypothetical protein
LAREVQTFLSKNAIFWGGMARKVQSFEQKSWSRELKDISISNILKSVQNSALLEPFHLKK